MNTNIFYSGVFDSFKVPSINKSINESIHMYTFDSAENRPKVFISHKHSDLEDLKGLIGFLEKQYNVIAYTDGNDSTLPKVTSAETAEAIKETIKRCDKFILLATNGAIKSKWCNWELGYGDATKGKGVAIFPINDTGLSISDYSGNEYMELYPSIVYRDGTTNYISGTPINEGFYIRIKRDKNNILTPLKHWLEK
jgi:hypothetical protein